MAVKEGVLCENYCSVNLKANVFKNKIPSIYEVLPTRERGKGLESDLCWRIRSNIHTLQARKQRLGEVVSLAPGHLGPA